MKKKLKLIALGFGVICISALLSFVYTKSIVKRDLDELNLNIEKLFKNNEVIVGGILRPISGTMSKNKMEFYSDFQNGDVFTIIKLRKKDDQSFIEETITPGSTLTYKEPEYNNNDYFTYPTYRPTFDQCYIDAYNYLLKGNSNQNSDISNKYNEILEFPSQINTKYHSIYVKAADKSSNGVNPAIGNVFNNIWTIKYYTDKRVHVIDTCNSEITDLKRNNLMLFVGSGIIIYLLIILMFMFREKSIKYNKSLFNKNWKSAQNSSILIINKNHLGKLKVSIIDDGKTKKGLAKIAEKGTHLQLSFEDQEYFYKINLLTPIKLELENLVTTAVLKYELLGSNAYNQPENKTGNQISMPMGEIDTKNKIIKDIPTLTEKDIKPIDDNTIKDKFTQSNETIKSKEFTIQKKWLITLIIGIVLILGSLVFYIVYNYDKEPSKESTNPSTVKQTAPVKKGSIKNTTETSKQDTTEIEANANKKIKIGDIYAGGIVFYIDKTGKHGKVCSAKDQSSESDWYNAKQICSSLNLNGYTNWHLPSISELYLIYKHLSLNKIGNFISNIYWSSSDDDNNMAWARILSTGDRIQYNKTSTTLNFRAVRAF